MKTLVTLISALIFSRQKFRLIMQGRIENLNLRKLLPHLYFIWCDPIKVTPVDYKQGCK